MTESLAKTDMHIKYVRGLTEENERALLANYADLNARNMQSGNMQSGNMQDECDNYKLYYDYIIEKKEAQEAAFDAILKHLAILKASVQDDDVHFDDILKEQANIEKKKQCIQDDIHNIMDAEQ